MSTRTLFFVFALLVFSALPAEAATLRAVSAGATAGSEQAIVIAVRLSTEQSSVNTVGGRLSVPSGVVIDSIDTAGSAFSLWVTPPTYVIADGGIEFLGGMPNGVSAGADILLFTVHAHARNVGEYNFEPEEVVAYRNDGEGTREAVGSESAQVTVDDSSPAQRLARTPASSPLVIDRGSDSVLYDGAAFIAFYGGDRGRGVDHYEVREGWWHPSVRAEHLYVLADQSLHSTIWVSAVAPDGSRTTRTLPSERIDYLAVVSVLAFVLLGWFLVRLIHRRFSASSR